MRQAITVVALALCLVGCEALSPRPADPFELGHSQEPADGRRGACSLGWWTAGQLVIDEEGGTSVIVEGGDFGTVGAKLKVLWWPKYTGRRVGNEVEVLDPDAKVVATTGRKYRIDAAFPFSPEFVVCGSEVTFWG